jgi:crotonobetainyl-CoA:carnitine CoA-transferase CaiB-like acyl-CoA transferase
MSGALDGIRVLEAASFVSGPCAAKLLCDLGAEVIKIEHPAQGDPLRQWDGRQYSPWFVAHNCGKRSLTLRLDNADANDILERLLPRIDVVVENFRPGVAERFGLGYERVCALAPGVIYCSISGAGQHGPYATQPFFDTIGQSLSGLLGFVSDRDDPGPRGPAFADTMGGIFAAYGVLAALHQRTRTGKGQKIETSILEATMHLLAEPFSVYLNSGELPDLASRRQAAQAHIFECRDGALLSIHLSSPSKFWDAFLRVVGLPRLADDPRFRTRPDRIRHYDALHEVLVPVFLSHSRREWLDKLVAAAVPCAPVHALNEVLSDPQVRALDPICSATHPVEGPVQWIANPIHFSTERRHARPPPSLGENTDAILAELGYARDVICRLRNDGTI